MIAGGRPGIRLDDLLARGTTLRWAEAVALVHVTCRQLVVTAASGFPTTAQIMVYEEGAVVALATVDQPQVGAAADLLVSILPGDIPAHLRLLVSQATGTGRRFASLNEFAVALAYCGRSDPRALLRALYRRAAAAPAGPARTMAPPASCVGVPAEPRTLAKSRKSRAWVVAAAAVVTVAIVAMWFIGTRFDGTSTPSGLPTENAGKAPASTSTSPAAAKKPT